MEQDWTRIFSSDKPYQIEIAKALLEEAGIATFQMDKKDSVYIFGEIELYVPKAEEYNGKLILTEHDLL
ncbi:hypothetical protein BH11BAC2_BH11BAC2_21210 [soil metagenome]